MQNIQSQPVSKNDFNIKEEVFKYLSKWKWFVVGVVCCVILGHLYLRYSIPQYKASATILVKDDRKGGIASELSAFSDIGLLSNVKSNVDNEVEVIKSRTLIKKTIEDLELTTVYMNLGRVKSEELYKNYPVKMVVLSAKDDFENVMHVYRIQSLSDSEFELFDAAESKIGGFKYGDKVKLGNDLVLQFLKTKDFVRKKEFNIGIYQYPKSQLVESFKSRLTANVLSKYTSVIELSLINPVKAKAVDFLDGLVANYNQDAIADKKYISENTSKFIDQRLKLITEELKTVEEDVERFKKKNQVTDIVSEAGLYLENASQVEKQKVANLTQIKIAETMLDYLGSSDVSEPLPANIIEEGQGAASLISDYNKLILERNKISKTGTENPLVKSLDAKITSLKQSVKSSLLQYKASLEIQQKDLAREKAKVSGKISQIPTQERLFRDIDRKQHVKEALFLYLLEKREEMAISLAVTAPNAKVIDSAMASSASVSQNKRLIYLGSILLGLFIPFGIIYVMDLFNTKVKTRADLEQNTTVPFLGEIPKLINHSPLLEASSRINTAEAIRIVRTNLEFLLSQTTEGKAKTIFLTSTYPKEGKTFLSVNLASIISQSNHKVLLIGADIRNPKFDDYLEIPQQGLTNYLADKSNASVSNFIVQSKEFENLDVLPSGVIPPNPAELLMSAKVGEMFNELKEKYDYIIVDTAPVSLVSDALIVAKYADAFVYVVRAHFLDKSMLDLPQKMYSENKLNNMSIVLNDTSEKKGYGYGYGYSYGYSQEADKKSFFSRILKR